MLISCIVLLFLFFNDLILKLTTLVIFINDNFISNILIVLHHLTIPSVIDIASKVGTELFLTNDLRAPTLFILNGPESLDVLLSFS